MFRARAIQLGGFALGVRSTGGTHSNLLASSYFVQSKRFQSTDAISLLVDDHRRVDTMLEQLISSKENQGSLLTPDVTEEQRIEQRDNLNKVIKELSVHTAVEELHLYPLVRTSVKEGDHLVDRSLQEHLRVKESLKKLLEHIGTLKGEPKKWPELPVEEIRLLRDVLREHVKEEEEHIFADLKKGVAFEVLQDLGKIIQMSKTTPPWPHPDSPNAPSPPAAAAAAGIAGVGLMREGPPIQRPTTDRPTTDSSGRVSTPL